MKRCSRVLLPCFLIGLMFCAPFLAPVHGAFQVEAGQKLYYEVTTSSIDVTYDLIQESFVGFDVGGEMFPEGDTITVNITSITASEANWKILAGDQFETGSVPDVIDYLYLAMLLFQSAVDSVDVIDINDLYTGGELTAVYPPPLFVPPIVNVAPVTWDAFEILVTEQEDFLNSVMSSYTINDFGGSYDDSNGLMTFNWWYEAETDVGYVSFTLSNYNTLVYNLTTGILKSMDISTTYAGVISPSATDIVNFSISTESQVTQVAPPKGSGFDFAEFFANYKWYIIGGGAGLVAVLVVISVVLVVRGRKKPKKKKSKGKK